MSRILYAWELGGGQGHIRNFLPVAAQLCRLGHRLSALVKDPAAVTPLLMPLGIETRQAALSASLPPPQAAPLNYAHMLGGFDYSDAPALRRRVELWRAAYAALRPDLIVADHAPTAVLAARGTYIRCATYGPGFCVP
ncbi:MAG: glycosyltransferase, partial [Burkholderiales bacterium]